MPTSKVEMSLDDIIKANRNKAGKAGKKNVTAKGGRSNNNRKAVGGQRIQRNKGGVISKPQRKGNASRLQQRKGVNVRKGNANSAKVPKATQIATQKLVNKLVKKALAQKAVTNNTTRVVRNLSNKRGGVRFVKKTVVLNRVSPKSRVIRRRPAVVAPIVETVAFRPRNQIRYVAAQPVVQYVTASSRRNNSFRPHRNARFAFVQPQPVIQHRAAPNFRMVPVNDGSLRDQIKAMRQTAYVRPRMVQQQVQRRPQFRQRQQRGVVQEVPRRQQQPRRRFQNNNQRRQNDTFFDPPNFLQRI